MVEPGKFQLNQHIVKLSLNDVEEEYIVLLDKRTKEMKRPLWVYIKWFPKRNCIEKWS